jgi:pyruvate kinase
VNNLNKFYTMKKIRRTKIIATIGPASIKPLVMKKLIMAGANIFRYNLKHGTLDSHLRAIEKARKTATGLGQKIEVLVDVPKPDFFVAGDFLDLCQPDYIALSLVRKSSEIVVFRKYLKKIKIDSQLIAKIETNESLNYFASILDKVDSLMVARGDLGRSIPIEQVPFVQKEIIQASLESGKSVIVATEMLLSMTKNKIPTRAEASDVANAVLDGCQAVMLSEETAIGKNPVESVNIMDKIICEAESWKNLHHLHIFSAKNRRFKFGA